jgi:hypothetical protein
MFLNVFRELLALKLIKGIWTLILFSINLVLQVTFLLFQCLLYKLLSNRPFRNFFRNIEILIASIDSVYMSAKSCF